MIHARLENKWNDLNSDLFNNHLRPDSCCDCGNVETADYYLFACSKYSD